jgi:hypothetical protein
VIGRAPTSSDYRYGLGDEWLDTTTYDVYKLSWKQGKVATWIQIGDPSGMIHTITCDTGSVNPIAATVISTANNGLETVGSTNTLTHQFTPVASGYTGSQREYAQFAAQTTDATPTDVVSIPLAVGEMISVEARINAFRSDFTESLVARVFTGARRPTAGNVTVINTVIDILEDSAGAPLVTVNADVANQTLDIRFVGEVAKTYNVVSTYEYHKTLTNA